MSKASKGYSGNRFVATTIRILRGRLTSSQLREAEVAHAEAIKASVAHSTQLSQQARKFQKQQADVDRRLLIVTRSETSDDAVQMFNSNMDKLHQLDVAKGYMEQLVEVEKLRFDQTTSVSMSSV